MRVSKLNTSAASNIHETARLAEQKRKKQTRVRRIHGGSSEATVYLLACSTVNRLRSMMQAASYVQCTRMQTGMGRHRIVARGLFVLVVACDER